MAVIKSNICPKTSRIWTLTLCGNVPNKTMWMIQLARPTLRCTIYLKTLWVKPEKCAIILGAWKLRNLEMISVLLAHFSAPSVASTQLIKSVVAMATNFALWPQPLLAVSIPSPRWIQKLGIAKFVLWARKQSSQRLMNWSCTIVCINQTT